MHPPLPLLAALLLTPLAALQACPASKGPVFDVRAFGAKGDGVTLDTQAVQAAIAACHAGGGGIVEVPPGNYHVGTLQMLSNVTLKLSDGASLLGSQTLGDYAADVGGLAEEPAFQKCLIHAENATNLGFQGAGTIDGRGSMQAFPVKVDGKAGERPSLMRLANCQRVRFNGVTFKNPASWGLHLVGCQDVRFEGVTILSRENNANNDGIDLDGCRDVLVENCHINSGDDAVCLKSTLPQPCANIVVRSCRLSSKTAGFKLGTSSRSGFVDIRLMDSQFHDCPMGAVKLLLVDGGRLERVTLERLTMENVGGPIFIRLGNRGRRYDKPSAQIYGKDVQPEGAPVGVIRGVTIKQVTARVSGNDRDRQGILITGIPGHRVQDVTLEDIRVTFPGGGTREDATRQVPEDLARYPEQYFFGVLPAWGLFVRHAEGVRLQGIQLDCTAGDARPPVFLEDVSRWDAREVRINGRQAKIEPPLDPSAKLPVENVPTRAAAPKIAGPYVHAYIPGEDVFPGPDSPSFKAGQSYPDWVPNDHAILQGPDGRWHALGITHPKPPGYQPPRYGKDVHEAEWLLFHAAAPQGALKQHLATGAWRDQVKVLAPATRPGDPESPSVVEHNGQFYLFVCLWDAADEINGAYDNRTLVFRSGDPLDFKTAPGVAELQAHAPEVFRDEEGGWFISSVEWPHRGVSIAPLAWE